MDDPGVSPAMNGQTIDLKPRGMTILTSPEQEATRRLPERNYKRASRAIIGSASDGGGASGPLPE